VITIKEEFLTSDKVRRAVDLAGSDAVVMWLALKLYVAENLTDGFIPEEEIPKLKGAPRRRRNRALQSLVDCGRKLSNGTRSSGLVDRTEHGWMLHDYLDHAQSATELKEKRRRDRARKRRERDRKRNDSAATVTESQGGRPCDTSVTSAVTPPGRPRGVRELSAPPPQPTVLTGEEDPRPDRLSELPAPRSVSSSGRSDPMAYMRGESPTQREDVSRVRGEWMRLFGYPEHKWRGPSDLDAATIADAIDDYGEEKCMLMLRHAPSDGMVNGTADPQRRKHDSIRYLFENERFVRLLREAQELTKAARKTRTASEVIRRAKEL
jgi:hypothetical protein